MADWFVSALWHYLDVEIGIVIGLCIAAVGAAATDRGEASAPPGAAGLRSCRSAVSGAYATARPAALRDQFTSIRRWKLRMLQRRLRAVR